MATKILVVEDEITLRETLLYNLKKQGYELQATGDGGAALDLIRQFQPDLIILDLMLPGMDGLEITRQLRKEISTPVLMLTARADEIDRVVGLEIGADDYMTKPFSMHELMARVKAMLRRRQMLLEELERQKEEQISPPVLLKYGNLSIDESRREVMLSGKVIPLKPREYDLLVFMAKHRGQVLSRETILDQVWGWEYFGNSRTVDVHVGWLRAKIEADTDDPKRIITVRGAGYRFEG